MLKKVVWQEDGVYSLRLRDDLFTLAQMRKNHIMQFFDISSATGEWSGVDLNSVPSLFFIFVSEKNLKSLFVGMLTPELAQPSAAAIPKLMLSAVLGGPVYGANLVELPAHYDMVGTTVKKADLSIENDLDLIYKHELIGMVGAPEKLKNRLIRYFDTGVNWDESKAFLFKGINPPPAAR